MPQQLLSAPVYMGNDCRRRRCLLRPTVFIDESHHNRLFDEVWRVEDWSWNNRIYFCRPAGTCTHKRRITTDLFRITVSGWIGITNYIVSQKTHQRWNGIARNYEDRFWWYVAEIFKMLQNRVCMLHFSCRFGFSSTFRLSDRRPNIARILMLTSAIP